MTDETKEKVFAEALVKEMAETKKCIKAMHGGFVTGFSLYRIEQRHYRLLNLLKTLFDREKQNESDQRRGLYGD